jgi:colicin import membrane protein
MATLAPAREHFLPPPTPGLGRAVLMALVAHAALVLALSFAVQWHQSAPEPVTFAAELWAQLPTEASPPAAEPLPAESVIEPPPDPTPAPEPKPVPQPAPPPLVAAPPEPPKQADIALEKKKALQEAKKKQELADAKAQAALQLEKDKGEKQKKRKAEAEKLQADKDKTAKRLKEEKAAEAQRKKEEKKAAEEAELREKWRKEDIERTRRSLDQSVPNGEPVAKGTAAQNTEQSAKYGGKILAAIRPNITQLKEITGNPSVVYDVYTDASGNVLSVKLQEKSGDSYWDETAYNAILKTGKLPRNEEGRVPSPMRISITPKPR